MTYWTNDEIADSVFACVACKKETIGAGLTTKRDIPNLENTFILIPKQANPIVLKTRAKETT